MSPKKQGQRKLPQLEESSQATKCAGPTPRTRKEIKAKQDPKESNKSATPRQGMQQAGKQLRTKGITEADKAGRLSKDKSTSPLETTLDQTGQLMTSERGQNTKQPSDQWTPDDYRSFISAVYNEGMKHASPSVIRESMSANSPMITSERVKSHLQKYRLYRTKSKGEFMSEYDSWMAKVTNAVGASDLAMSSSPLPSPTDALQLLNTGIPCAGSLAAFLTYSVVAEERSGDQEKAPSSDSDRDPGAAGLARAVPQNAEQQEILARLISESSFVFPTLTEEEKQSALGRMLMHVMALCMELNDRILEIRQGQASNAQLLALPDVGLSSQERAHEGLQQQRYPMAGRTEVCPPPRADEAVDDDDDVTRKKPRFDNYAFPSAHQDQPVPPYRPMARSPPLQEAIQSLSETYAQATASDLSLMSSNRPQPFSNASMPPEDSAATYPTQSYPPAQDTPLNPSTSHRVEQVTERRLSDPLPSGLDEAQRLYYPSGNYEQSDTSNDDKFASLSSRVQSPGVEEDE